MHRGAPCTTVHLHLCAPAPWCITVVMHRIAPCTTVRDRPCAPALRCIIATLHQGARCSTMCDPDWPPDPAARAPPCPAGATTARSAGGRFASRREFPPTHPEIPWQGHRGIGASAPCLAAVPVVCETTRLQLGSTTTQAVAAFLFYPALVQCKANSGGRSRSQRAVLATSIRCLFSHHQRRRLTWPQRRCVTQRSNASTVPPNTRLLR